MRPLKKTKPAGWFLVVIAVGLGTCLGADSLSLSEVERAVLTNNATLKSSVARWTAMRERVPQARAWDDPMTGLKLMRSGTTRLNDFGASEWMVSQALPISGKNRSRGRIAEAEARAVYEDVRRARLNVLAKTRATYFRLSNAYEQLALNKKNADLLGQFVELSKAKYEVGRSQAEVLAAQTDESLLEQERARLEEDLSNQQSALNVLMNQPATAPLGQPAPLSFRSLRRKPGELEALILARRPEIAAADLVISAEQAKLQLARREWIPDPQVQIEARHFSGSSDVFTEYNTGIVFSLPWVNPGKYSAGVREARQGVEGAQRMLEAEKTGALGILRDQLRRISSLARQVQISREKIVPLAAQTVETLQAAYGADTVGYLELLTAQRTLRDAEAAATTQLADYLAALADLEALVGLDGDAPKPKTPSRKSKP